MEIELTQLYNDSFLAPYITKNDDKVKISCTEAEFCEFLQNNQNPLKSFSTKKILDIWKLCYDVGYEDALVILLQHHRNQIPIENLNNALYLSAKAGHKKVLQALLTVENINVNTPNLEDETALMAASANGDVEAVRVLIAAGADVNYVKKRTSSENAARFDTALHLAAKNGHTEIVQVLLQTGIVNVDTLNDLGLSALDYAHRYGHKKTFQALLKEGAYHGTPIEDFIGLITLTVTPDYVREMIKYRRLRQSLMRAIKTGSEGLRQWINQNQAKPEFSLNLKDSAGNTALMYAVKKGDLESVNLLLQNGARVNDPDRHDNTALTLAAELGHTEIVQTLLQVQGIAINHKNRYLNGNTALMLASQAGHTEIVRALINAGAGTHQLTNNSGETALMLAAIKGHSETAKALLETQDSRTSINHFNGYGYTALMCAVRYGNTETVQALIHAGAHVDAIGQSGNSALILAVRYGTKEMVKALIEAGAKPDHRDQDGYTAFSYAFALRRDDIQEILRDAGSREDILIKERISQPIEGFANLILLITLALTRPDYVREMIKYRRLRQSLMRAIKTGEEGLQQWINQNRDKPEFSLNLKDSAGNTALMYAVKKGDPESVRLLLQNGARVNHANRYGNTALIYAVKKGDRESVSLLLQNGARVNHVNRSGNRALTLAIELGHTEIVKALLVTQDSRNSINDFNQYGCTPLMWAVQRGNKETVQALIDAKADVNAIGQGGNSVLILAVRYGTKEMVQALIKAGSDVHHKDKDGYTAFRYAFILGRNDIQDILREAGSKDDIPFYYKKMRDVSRAIYHRFYPESKEDKGSLSQDDHSDPYASRSESTRTQGLVNHARQEKNLTAAALPRQYESFKDIQKNDKKRSSTGV